MKRPIAGLSLMAVLALMLALCLLAMAGPALAGSPFEGNPPLWGGHDFNAKMYLVGDGPEGSVECLSVSSDPWASGTLLLWFDGDWVDIGDHAHVYGHWSLSNPVTGGTWAGNWEAIHSVASAVERPYQNTAVITGTGSHAYAGYSIAVTSHTASGQSPFIMKGSYWLSD